MEKRTLLAVLLSAIVWIGWYVWFRPEAPKGPEQAAQQAEERVETKKSAQESALPIVADSQASISAPRVSGTEKTVEITTDKYNVTLTTEGAAIKSVKYLERDIEMVVSESPLEARRLIDFGLHFSDREFLEGNALDSTLWKYSRQGSSVRFYTRLNYNGTPLRVEKIYTFKQDAYEFSVSYRISNLSSRNLVLNNGTVIFSPGDMLGPNMDFENRYNQVSSIYSNNGDFETGHKGSGFFSEGGILKKEAGSINWMGISSRYFLVILLPQGFSGSGVVWDNRDHTGFRTGMYAGISEIPPGAPVERSFRVFLGDRDKEKLGKIDPSIVDAADVSKWIEPIRYFVIWALMKINGVVGNMGWALVIFSILTKIVFMPLTMKSTESMKRMQQLTPMLNELKAKYKDKPEVMQKEMMKMYKEHKVNPMGGCLPILLQMPFFFGLYSALINSIDLWHAPFILWMKDLSMPDTVLTVSGFNLNILPIIMTATTFLQQKMTTVETGQQQKIMMMVMPLVFIFIFWTMPSGLVLYWALQNIFQIVHQLIVNKFGKKEE